MDSLYELTILMPCLNEAETLETCIGKAQTFLRESGIHGEVIVADNGSTDGSQAIAQRCGARLVNVAQKGYGAALIGGCLAATSEYVIMGDADDSYDFLHLMPFVEKLREGYDLVMGNRFAGGIAKGAMPPLHRYLGNPVLSFLGRLFYPSVIQDFHCGLRGYRTQAIRELDLQTTGMEYASEMVVQATLHHLKMTEVPTTLSPDGRTRPPHLRSWSDGWRHLKFLLIHSPNWLFLYPGMALAGIGLVLMILLTFGPLTVENITFDIHTQLYAGIMTIVGVQVILFSVYTKAYAANTGFIPVSRPNKRIETFTANKGVLIGLILLVLGIAATIAAFAIWGQKGFGALNPQQMMRITIPAVVAICIGLQLIFGSLFMEILNVKHR
ncbi:MAG TPA: glycosyltransferase family 2 protein [Candidatus Limiplasma sp.]|nr:glycosyltransferase family 2 protein [Candidatus Limiplasma sp.]HRX07741.1 glycosyltransferase family 2 protein [Candidatus Limiplasma sp.]